MSACTGDGTSLRTPDDFDEVDVALSRPCRADGFSPRLLTEFAPLSLQPLLEAPDSDFFETSSPTAVEFDSENNMIVARRNGVIESHSGGQVAILADLSADTSTVADQGVLALDWLDDTNLLVLRTAGSGATVLTVVDGDPSRASAPIELLRVEQPDERHNGGGLAVDRAIGEVFVGIGDGGEQGDPDGQAGDATNSLGTILRGTVDINTQRLIPTSGRTDLIWATGVRNPHRIWLDGATAWVTDVGENCREELNRLDTREMSYDLGWNAWEGDIEFVADDTRETTSPLITYGHDRGRCAIIGGVELPATFDLPGAVAVADFCSGEVFAVDSDGIIGVLPIQVTQPVDVSVSADGELIVTSLDGSIQAVRHTS
ncbi:MAG: PQQ-dependent sugar dehydrogenase [Actinobacteria bacterium]|nr:PQQ-dependent sugar dehydrogenase [Actinomycetota bacterium]